VPGVRVADDLGERRFRPDDPNVLWVADITYLRTWEGWLYLAAVQDAFSRRIVGWSMADHLRAELVVDALAANADPVRQAQFAVDARRAIDAAVVRPDRLDLLEQPDVAERRSDGARPLHS
jgi:hypothetical protein